MADQDRSLKDVIKFVDQTGSIDDAAISDITQQLKFSEVLDLVSAVKRNDLTSAKELLSKYNDIFQASGEDQQTEGFNAPQIKQPQSNLPMTSTTKPTTPTIKPAGQDNDDEDVESLINDPAKKNSPEVKQIQTLLQKLQQR